MSKKQVYMDNNATTPLHPEVKKALKEGMDIYGNASSFHSFGRAAKKCIEDSRNEVASFIGAHSEEIVFVGSGTEANNTVLNMFSCHCPACAARGGNGIEIVTSTVEHPCILRAAECLVDKGTNVKFVRVDAQGKIDMEHLESIISSKTSLVSIMMANNEMGTIMDIKNISRIAHAKGALMHTDAVQAVGKIPIDVMDLEVDFLTMSAHKIYGPKGVGALYVKRGMPFCPFIRGGHQERGRRAGTENTLGIIGTGRAIEMAKKEMNEDAVRLKSLKGQLKEGIQKKVPDIRLNGHPTDCLPGTLNVSFPGAEGESILLYLDLEGVAVSTGSACASGSLDPSHVLLAMGLRAEDAHSSIRFSLGRENTEEDVEYVLKVLPPVIEKIRKMSTVYAREK